MKNSNQDWNQVRDIARTFEGNVRDKWPAYYEEMCGMLPLLS